MSSAFPFPVTPRRKRSSSGADPGLYKSFTTPIRLPEPQSTPGSHCVPELDWGLTPDTADHYPTTPSDKASPSPVLRNASDFSIVRTRPSKQLRRSGRVQPCDVSKPSKLECTSQIPATIFSPFFYPMLPSLPPLPTIVQGDISWKNSSFFELSRALSNNTNSQSTVAPQLFHDPRLAVLRHASDPAPKRIKKKADPIEENNKQRAVLRAMTPTVVRVPGATPDDPTRRQKETYSELTGITRGRFSRILPPETLERVWEDKQRCVASLVTKPDVRCSALAKSPKGVKKWIFSQLSDSEAASDLMAWEDYVRELICLTTCTAYHRSIAEEQLERLLDRYHGRRSRHVGNKHDFSQQDLRAVQCWLAALTCLPTKAAAEAVQSHQQIRFVPRSTTLPPVFEGVSPASKKHLPTSEPEVELNDKVLSLDTPARPQVVVETWEGFTHSCKALPFERLLALLEIDLQRTTCIGETRRGGPCGVRVAKASRNKALDLLRNILGLPSTGILECISSLLLCKRRHQAQMALISSQWLQSCSKHYTSQEILKEETSQITQHKLKSTLTCQEARVSKTVRTTHSLDSCGNAPESDANTMIAATLTARAVTKTETAQIFNKRVKEITETLTTTKKTILTVEKRKKLTSNSQGIKSETVVTAGQLMKTASWHYSPQIDRIKFIQTRSTTVALRQSLSITRLNEADLVSIQQRFSYYTPGKAGSTSVEKWLNKRLNNNLTKQEFERPSEKSGQKLQYPSQSKDYPGQGLIYLYWIPGNFGFVKIGKTSGESTEKRLKRWKQQCGHKTEECTRGERALAIQLRHVYRVEKLVQDELKDYRIKEDCCEKCGKEHREWFAVSQSHALKVIQKWSDWIMTEPYIETRGVWHLKEPIGIDDILCKPIEVPVGHGLVLPAPQGRQQTRLKIPRRT